MSGSHLQLQMLCFNRINTGRFVLDVAGDTVQNFVASTLGVKAAWS
ncbi:MAG: hypothetical protein AABP62_05475 [Planctomycetota bacterium]